MSVLPNNAANSIFINSGGALYISGPYSTVANWLASGVVSQNSSGVLALVGSDTEPVNLSSMATAAWGWGRARRSDLQRIADALGHDLPSRRRGRRSPFPRPDRQQQPAGFRRRQLRRRDPERRQLATTAGRPSMPMYYSSPRLSPCLTRARSSSILPPPWQSMRAAAASSPMPRPGPARSVACWPVSAAGRRRDLGDGIPPGPGYDQCPRRKPQLCRRHAARSA